MNNVSGRIADFRWLRTTTFVKSNPRPTQVELSIAAQAKLVICDHTIDITYIPTAEGWLYLAVVLDLYSRRIVGWAMRDSLHRQLVIDALHMALTVRQPAPGLLHHSDQGSQYASDDYQALLTKNRMVASMSRKGNCYDNAPAESFFGTLKTELVFHQQYATHAQARLDIFEYIEVF
jgi:putative transposase